MLNYLTNNRGENYLKYVSILRIIQDLQLDCFSKIKCISYQLYKFKRKLNIISATKIVLNWIIFNFLAVRRSTKMVWQKQRWFLYLLSTSTKILPKVNSFVKWVFFLNPLLCHHLIFAHLTPGSYNLWNELCMNIKGLKLKEKFGILMPFPRKLNFRDLLCHFQLRSWVSIPPLKIKQAEGVSINYVDKQRGGVR